MADEEIQPTLDLALRIGEILLSSGAGAADVSATMLSVTTACGLRHCEADVTYTALRLSHQPGSDTGQQSRMRQVRHRTTDYTDLTDVDLLVRALVAGEIERDEARARLAGIVSTGHPYPRWAVTLAWGVMGVGVSLVIGAGWIVAGLAFLATTAIDRVMLATQRLRLPAFYQQVAGGLVASLLTVAVAASPLEVTPSTVIIASIIMLLAGVTYLGAVQDALSGYYVTASARGLEATLLTAGIIAGVSGGLAVGEAVGHPLFFNARVTSWSALPVTLLGAAIAAAAFAFASYAPLRALVPIGTVGLIGQAVTAVLEQQELGRAWATATGALAIGVVSYSVAGRVRVPPLVVVVSAVVPLLPGLAVYAGLTLMSLGDTTGLLRLAAASAIIIGLASGVILGEFLAQPLRREARRLEQRLAGPRLVGPLRARSSRRRRPS